MEFYNRRIKEKQEGKQITYGYVKTALKTSKKSGAPPSHTSATPDNFIPDKGHVLSDVNRQKATLRHMYKKWCDYSSHTRTKAPSIDFDKFHKMIKKKTDQIRDKKECKAVKFRIVLKNGKVKINAKTIK